ncbi:SsgA family sporulation/cell division regulator [Amycolatopsis sp. Poz14]|uniref:SsgA family sporulation/cell division regulator n=1 Tax=Amycolatopsis sp. Poz14 TaxID=1447705 RepID=UPI001EE942F5|nr:SsgA family sporulation/cell division regulator [Amycolatopsis sp. Poz14]
MKLAVPVAPLVIMGGREPQPLPMILSYEPNRDPYAVTLALSRDPSLAWLLGRELLRDGLTAEVGAGAVRVAPSADFLALGLSCPCCGQPVGLTFFRQPIAAFVELVFRLVPEGRESDRLDWSDLDEVLS